jgi:hypothetical protein
VATDPSAAPVPQFPPASEVKLRLAQVGVFIPAAVIDTWTDRQRLDAELWATAEQLVRSGTTELEVPERPAYVVSYAIDAEMFTRDPDGTVRYAGSGTVVAPDTWDALYEGWALGQVQKQEAAAVAEAPADYTWVVVDLGAGDGLARYQVMNRFNRERRAIDAEWAQQWAAQYADPSSLELAQDFAVKLSDDADAEASPRPLGALGAADDLDPPPPADEDSDPPPATVRTALTRAGHLLSDLERIHDWTPAQREEAVAWAHDYAGAKEAGMSLPPLPPHLAEIPWTDGEGGVKVAPPAVGERFNFDLVGKKPVRVRDTDTASQYGDNWNADEAKAVLAGWRNGEAVTLKGRALFPRDPSVKMEQR